MTSDLIRESLASLVSTGVCEHCDEAITKSRSFGWVHDAHGHNHCNETTGAVASPKPLDLRSLDPEVRAALIEALHPEPQELGMVKVEHRVSGYVTCDSAWHDSGHSYRSACPNCGQRYERGQMRTLVPAWDGHTWAEPSPEPPEQRRETDPPTAMEIADALSRPTGPPTKIPPDAVATRRPSPEPLDAADWYCEGEAVGWAGAPCSASNPIHSAPCGPVAPSPEPKDAP